MKYGKFPPTIIGENALSNALIQGDNTVGLRQLIAGRLREVRQTDRSRATDILRYVYWMGYPISDIQLRNCIARARNYQR